MSKDKKIKGTFSILILLIAIAILYNIPESNYFISLFFGLAVGCIIIFINWLSNRKKVAQLNKIIASIKEIYKLEQEQDSDMDFITNDKLSNIENLFCNFIDGIENTFSHVNKNTLNVSKIAEKVLMDVSNVSSRIKKINKSINNINNDNQSISDSISKITLEIKEVSTVSQDTAVEVNEIAEIVYDIKNCVDKSQKGVLDVKIEIKKIEEISLDTINTTEKLGKAAEEIGKIIDTIKFITNQTNMLALNAAIEAARAGESGRGFSVVADEIRKLAENNSQSAKIIESLIMNIQQMVSQTIKAAADVGTNIKYGSSLIEDVYVELESVTGSITNINSRIQNVSASIQEQSAANEELSQSMENINNSNVEIASAIRQVADNIATQSKTISKLSNSSFELNESSEELYKVLNKGWKKTLSENI